MFIDNTEEMDEMRRLSKYLGVQASETTTLVNLAQILFHMSDYCRAISFYKKLLTELPDDLPLVINCLSIMGQSYKSEPNLSLESFEQSLELQLKYDPDDQKMLASIYNNLGLAHRRLQSNKEIIIQYYEKAFQMCVSDPDQKNIDWCLAATFLNNMVTADPTGDSNSALERERLVLDIRLKFLPLSHPLVATTYNTLAEIYSSRGEFEEALEHYNEALRIKRRYLPNESVSVAQTHSSIALLYLQKGDYELLSFVINNLAVTYIRLARYDEALECFSMHKTMITGHLSENYYDHGAILKNMGQLYMLQGNMNKSMEFYMLALEFYHRINLIKAPVVAQIYFYMGE